MQCPKCGNTNLQIITETETKGKDFSVTKRLLWCSFVWLDWYTLRSVWQRKKNLFYKLLDMS